MRKTPGHASDSAQLLAPAALEQYIERARQEWRNVGLAVAVVKGTDILYAGGFGVRRSDESAKVTSDTLFQVGSTTKSFTTAALALLVEEGALHWDAPISRYLPTFQLSDPWLTRHVTVRDALAHRVGIFDSLYPFLAILDTQASIQQLAQLAPNGPFRDSFCYSNLLYAAAGRVLEVLSGQSWGDFVRERLLVPLQMQRSRTSAFECREREQVTATFFGSRPAAATRSERLADVDIAMPHGWDADGSIRVLPWRTYDNAAAAGGLVSSAADMAKWLILNINAGRFEGRQLFSPEMIQTLHTTQNLHSIHQFPYAAASESYALGWFKAEFAGRVHLEHGGGMIGFPAYLAMIPQEKLAVVVLANGSRAARERLTLPYRMGLHKSVAFWVFDRLLGRPEHDWHQEFLARALEEEQDLQRKEEELQRARLPHAPASLPLEQYAGIYEDSKSRPIRVEVCCEQGSLVFGLPGAGAYRARLEHWHQDVFRLRSEPGVADVFETRFVTFHVDPTGRIASLSAFEMVFEPSAVAPEEAASTPELHGTSIVIDAVCPLVMDTPSYLSWYREGGVTALAPTMGSTESARACLDRLGQWHRLLRERDDLLLVRRAHDFELAKQSGRLGIYFHFQGADPIEDQLELVDLYKALGVGMVQLTYNIRNRVGDGCEERTDSGLSRFGIRLVGRLNQARVIVDCSHTGLRTSLDAIEHSNAPVVLSHSNIASVHPSPRNVSGQLVDAIAASGGVIGMVGFPAMVSGATRPSLDQFIAHIDATVERVGIDHVALGLDYYTGQAGVVADEVALRGYQEAIDTGIWTRAYPPPPHHYPLGIETPRTLQNLTGRLLERGYSGPDIRKLLGENWIRVMRAVWG